MMNTKEIKRFVILNIPYVIVGLLVTNLGEAWRLAAGTDISEKILALFGTIPAAFGNPLRVCILLICAWDWCAEPYCGLRYIFAVRMLKNTAIMWSTVLHVGERRRISSRLLHRSLRIM